MDNLSTVLTPTADQHFLMYFITGLYFAPDLKDERFRKSVLQRCAQCLPPYTSNQLAGSWMSMLEVERVYYYVLRKANESFIMKPPLLNQFFCGNLHIPGKDPTLAFPQFDDLFPPELHPHIQYGNEYDMVQNVVLINDPDISDVKPWDIERFKRLTGLEEFHLDKADAMLHSSLYGDIMHNVTVQEEITSEGLLHQGALQDFSIVPYTGARAEGVALTNNIASADHTEPTRLFLPSFPSREVWDNIVAATRTGFSVTGTAARGQVGPVLGLIDIGESEDSYLFRVSLPGVKRDEREFSCEVENDGKVLIRGVTTTGERTVCKYSHMFEMQSQNLCSSGHFSISFNLPGPVDTNHFTGNFGTDGILEGIVMKVGQY